MIFTFPISKACGKLRKILRLELPRNLNDTFLERSHKTLCIRPTIGEIQVINFFVCIFLMR